MIPAIFKNCFLFSGMSDSQREKLSPYFVSKRFSKNSTIFVENMQGESLFVIASGRVTLNRMVSEGMEKILVELTSGEAFGELALVDGGPRAVSARVVEDASIYILTREKFTTLINKEPELGVLLLFALLRRVVTEIRKNVQILSEPLGGEDA
jgi:CRP-like cAMP-binding protein